MKKLILTLGLLSLLTSFANAAVVYSLISPASGLTLSGTIETDGTLSPAFDPATNISSFSITADDGVNLVTFNSTDDFLFKDGIEAVSDDLLVDAVGIVIVPNGGGGATVPKLRWTQELSGETLVEFFPVVGPMSSGLLSDFVIATSAIETVPEPSAFFLIGLVGLVAAGGKWKKSRKAVDKIRPSLINAAILAAAVA